MWIWIRRSRVGDSKRPEEEEEEGEEEEDDEVEGQAQVEMRRNCRGGAAVAAGTQATK